jgi:hypothetical protein
VLAGQPRVARAEGRQLLDRFTPQPFTTLSALLGEAAERHQDTRWCSRAQPAAAFKKPPLLYVSVVEVAKRALQLLQRAENRCESRLS